MSDAPSVAPEPFAQRVTLEQIDRDIFTGHCHAGAPLRAYGGQIAAQSLMAAGHTVDDSLRTVHSLHGYFLRPGRTQDSITYLVDRPRDGGSFSTRIVRAVQQGETIFMLTASFAALEHGPEHQFEMPSAPPPDEIPSGRIPPSAFSEVIQLKVVEEGLPLAPSDGRYERLAWVRIDDDLPDDPLVQACALTYLSDLTMVSTALAPHGTPVERTDLVLASIDHAMWFSSVPSADSWLLYAQDTPVARNGHGLARGLFFAADGTLVASVVQESLMRHRRNT